MSEMTYAQKQQKIIRDIQIECAKAICKVCATRGEPSTNDFGLYVHHLFPVTVSGATVPVAASSSTFCMAGPIWSLIHGAEVRP